MQDTKPMTMEELKQKVPSAFATHPHESRSQRYSFIPTEKIVEDLNKLHWYPVTARQDHSKKTDGFQAHMLRFRKEFENIADRYTELVMLNSHNGRTRCKMFGGFCEVVCSNGLIIMTHQVNSSLNIMHLNYTFSDVQKIVGNIVTEADTQAENIKQYSSVLLDDEQRRVLAKTIAFKIYGQDARIDIDSLLNVRRSIQQDRNDLWTVWNVIQENVIKGGVKFLHDDNKITTSREVKNIRKEILSNLSLWAILTDSYKAFK
jgi:hypothetical protein